MNFADKKMSTRKGNIIALNEVLKEAVQRAQILILEKDGGNTGTKKANPLLAQAIGVGAVKYNILSQNRITDIVFDWDRMLSLEGNSAPYIQYTYARSRSILKKSEEWKDKKIDRERQIDLFQAIESDEAGQSTEQAGAAHSEKLLRKLIQFPEALLRTAQEYKPNLLCQYLYELAQTFNAFYHSAPVLQTENKEIRAHRLKLVRATATILEKGLELLGIEAVEKM
jgi:arginyl-tRNA synthetase